MTRCLAIALLLAGCAAADSLPDHPLVGSWQGTTSLTLKTTEYQYGMETGYWSAGRKDFRYKTAGGRQERCAYSLAGRVLVMTGCRLAGRYTRL
ncbi:MAG TPA: hypothetical protein VFY92_11950 [Hyphomicrobiaceae bacterium]|nr:hypothetical protein [Hyphomicrobiaceae bacterium]